MLKQVLNYISVDPTDADVKSIYIIRPGLAAEQYQSIQAALDRLQKALFYATSITTSEAQIRASEATQIQTYINDARTIQPDGILVVDDANNVMSDVRLEDGDTIVIPESSDTVMVEGEVQQPGAVPFSPQLYRSGWRIYRAWQAWKYHSPPRQRLAGARPQRTGHAGRRNHRDAFC
jgi:hypothetical protein